MRGTIITRAGTGLRLREEPSMESAVVCVLPSGTRVDAIVVKGEWLKVVAPDGRQGWVNSEYVRNDEGVGDISWGDVAEKIKNKVTSVAKSAVQTVKDTAAKVADTARTAYDAVTTKDMGTMYVTATGGLRLRAEPSTSAKDMNDTQPYQAAVTKVSGGTETEGWVRVRTGSGKTGYMSLTYLSGTKPAAQTKAETKTTDTASVTETDNQTDKKMTLPENAKKIIKWSVVGLGAAALGYGIYSATKKKSVAALPAPAKSSGKGLSGTGRRKSKKGAKRTNKKSSKYSVMGF